MKKIKYILLLIFALSFALSGCGVQTAQTFDSAAVDNAFNNFASGGKMAYVENELYVVYVSGEVVTLGVYKVNENGGESIFNSSEAAVSASSDPEFYQYGGALYSYNYDDKLGCYTLLKYDESKKSFVESDFKQKFYGEKIYISENLLVYYTPETDGASEYVLTIESDGETFATDRAVTDFYVVGTTIYLFNKDGWLYKADVSSGGECELLSKQTFENDKIFEVCGDYLYFDYSGNNLSEHKTGLYRYSFEDDNVELVIEKEINSVNSCDGKLYFAADDGIYVDKPEGKYEKISGIDTKELYILDEDWIYSLNDDNGKIYRISLDGENTEIIDFEIS